MCEAKLDEKGVRSALLPAAEHLSAARVGLEAEFLAWQQRFHVSPELKLMVADVESYLEGLREWLEQIEFGQAATRENGASEARTQEVVAAVAPRVISAFNLQHERFEEIVDSAPAELRPLYQAYTGRHWQKLFLGCPFGHRTFFKPLGYAGDYEMMNMIHRNQPEGKTLYDRLIHFLLVSQWPALSVRNRIAHLKEQLLQETARVARQRKRCRVLNIGCGPAREVMDLLEENAVTDHADFVFADFNEETLNFVSQRFEEIRRSFGRQAKLETWKTSVFQLLKRGVNTEKARLREGFDVIYCAGLFDYLTDETCRSLVSLFYESIRPGGLVMVANMKDEKPFRNFIESVLDWHLIYRDTLKLESFAPERALEHSRVEAEPVAVNLFLHSRRPD
jgi:extracellular factor (EF) 3-hydroxypalmitic acid methyl ester biosynthesis protein